MAIDTTLSQLGLDQREITIYTHLLEHGTRSIAEIVHETGFSKFSASAAIDSLLKRGFVSCFTENNQQQFLAEHPRKLEAYFLQKLTEYKSALDRLHIEKAELEGIRSEQKARVRFFQGKAGLQSMLDEFNSMEGRQAYLMYCPEQVQATFSEEERAAQQQLRPELAIQTESICFTNQDKLYDLSCAEKYKVPLEHFPFFVDIEIYDNKVAIATMIDDKHGVIIESKQIADSFRTIFQLAKKGAKK